MRTKHTVRLFVMAGLVTAQIAAAEPWYVALDGGTPNDGLSWATAFTNVQHAIDAASSGHTIYLKGETLAAATPTSAANQIEWKDKALTILGGYVGSGTPGARGDSPTILTQPTGSQRRILYSEGIDGGVLQDVVITGGDYSGNQGGGAHVKDCPDLTFINVSVTDNQITSTDGAGIYVVGTTTDLTITNSLVRGNRYRGSGGGAKRGGGLRIASGTVRMVDSVVSGNRVTSSGGGATSSGGGAYVDGTLLMRNCLVYGNEANWSTGPEMTMVGYGDGIQLQSGTLTLDHCTVAHNLGEGIRRNGGTATVNNSIVWGHFDGDIVGAVTLDHSNIGDGTNDGNDGCFSEDPRFRNGYYLTADSTSRNAGSVTAAVAGLDNRTTQVDGALDSGTVDLGYHYLAGVDTTYDDIYVALTGDDGNAGTSSGAPLRTITNALAKARDGSRIHIAAGTYDTATEAFPLVLANRIGMQLIGAGADGTVIDASGANQRVLSLIEIAGTSRIEGLTLTGGNPTDVAGGLYIELCADLTIASSAVVDNSTRDRRYGNGILAMDSGLTITNSVIARNFSSTNGGGGKAGGGMCLYYGSLLMVDSILTNNRLTPSPNTTSKGGGLYLNGGTARLRNCLVYGNNAMDAASGVTGLGDGLYLETPSTGNLTIEHSTVAYNMGEGIRRNGGTVTVDHAIVWGHMADIVGIATLSDSNIGDGTNDGNDGCFSEYPRFRNGYYLAADSTSRNAGSITAAAAGLDNRTTQVDGTLDSGAVDLGYHTLAGVDTTYDDIYVAMTGDDANVGTSSGAPLRTITNALAKARDGSRIHIAAGTYDTVTEGFPLVLSDRIGVQLLGAGADDTIINATGSNRRVLTLSDLDGPTRIADLTLTGGNNAQSGDLQGGAVFLQRCGGLTFSSLIITNNATTSGTRGIGVYAASSTLVVTNSVIADNYSSQSGGGGKMGGGMYLLSTYASILETVIATNRMTPSNATFGDGGGLYQDAGTLTLRNVLMYGNNACDAGNATGRGDGINLYRGTLSILNCTIADNVGQGVRREGGTATVENSILWGHGGNDVVGDVTLSYSNIEDGTQVDENGNISANPLFIDAPAVNYRLQVKGDISPSVNTGNPVPAAWMLAGVDLDGNDRILNDRVDQGAYENLVPPPGSLILLR